MADKQEYIELGLPCADVCQTLDRRRRFDELSQAARGAIGQLTSELNQNRVCQAARLTRSQSQGPSRDPKDR